MKVSQLFLASLFATLLAGRLPGLFQNASLGGKLAPKKRFNARGREFWLTIDDGPCRRDTEGMLEVLDSYRAKASFFLQGSRLIHSPHLARKILAAGHSVENHSFFHRSAQLWWAPEEWMQEELLRASHTIRCATGTSPRFFRAPAGRWSIPLLLACRASNLIPLGWSISARDGMCCGDLWKSMNRVIHGITPGAVVLVHQAGRRGRVEALAYLLHHLDRSGWKTTLPEPSTLRP